MDKWTEWIHLMHMHPISNIELYDDFFLVLYCMSDALLHFIYTIQHVYSLNYWPFGGKSKTKPKRTQYTYSHIQFLSFRNEIFTFSLIIFRSHFYGIFFLYLTLIPYTVVLGGICYWWLANQRHIWWWTVDTIDICKSKIW